MKTEIYLFALAIICLSTFKLGESTPADIRTEEDINSADNDCPHGPIVNQIVELKNEMTMLKKEQHILNERLLNLQFKSEIQQNQQQQLAYQNDVIIGNVSRVERETPRRLTLRILRIFRLVGGLRITENQISLCKRLTHDASGNRITQGPRPVLVQLELMKHKNYLLQSAVLPLRRRGLILTNRYTPAIQRLLRETRQYLKNVESGTWRSFVLDGHVVVVPDDNSEMIRIDAVDDLLDLFEDY